MDPHNHASLCEGVIAFGFGNPQHRPQYKSGNYPVYGTRVTPQLLSLFPSTPLLQPPKKRVAVNRLVWHDEEQMSEKDSGKDVINRSDRELRSHKAQKVHAGTAPTLTLSTFRAPIPAPKPAPKRVPEKTTAQKPVKKPRRKASLGSSEIRKTNGSASASSSRASVQNVKVTHLSLAPSQHTTSVQISGAQEVENLPLDQGKRHGPRPKSSRFRGVTHYKRTGRWEAHIWIKGKQIYLGASSTADQAARAYDRAAIHFRHPGAELNFVLKDYEGEIQRLMELPDSQVVKMLRKQSAGRGTPFPEYPPQDPPAPEQPHTPPPTSSVIRVSISEEENHEERPSSPVEETIPHVTQVDQSLGSCTSSIGTMVHSREPERKLSTFYAPKARHVSERREEYLQTIHNMLADLNLDGRTWKRQKHN